ncbi:MAG: Smr/MutS family protein [Deltaproteobacteria bacterium]|jgi:dsDNA-specific endonuclease/ATPase MutS2|nr:Smr/MutS family protein [Deltaproteobacteria bacterium]MBW2530249.1 Smr/MutS family protein [Deltaproteobacteria bacterium]
MDTGVLIGLGLVLVVLAWLWRRPSPQSAPAPDDEAPPPEDEPAVVEIEDAIDLHGFQPRDILPVVESYLEAAADKGFREVRLIHGKGKGVQRRRVQQLLSKHPLVEDYADAPAHRGGWGATLAWLKTPAEGARRRRRPR